MSEAFSPSQSTESFDLGAYVGACVERVERAMDRLIPSASEAPETLHQSMRYSLFAGGKRMRPALTIATADACGGANEGSEVLAAAVECVHTYSLIHDDLPCMDDDDFRRGKATNHKVYGEGIAVLAGDALLTIAFEIALQAPSAGSFGAVDFGKELAAASGSLKLIAGQVADLEGEGRELTLDQLQWIHERKTSALLTSAMRLGAMSVGASEDELARVTEVGEALGLAFQVVDDILDVTQTTEALGKTAGKDVKAMKATYPALLGLERSQEFAKELTERAYAGIDSFGSSGVALRGLATYLLERRH